MAQNLEYIYTLRDRYSKKLASITKKQIAFTEAYRKSMGKVNAAAVAHGRIIARNSRLYNINKQAMARVNSHLDILTRAQGQYTRQSAQKLSKLNGEWRKHGRVVRAQQIKQRAGGAGGAASIAARGGVGGGGLAGMATGVGGAFFMKSTLDTATEFYQNLNVLKAFGKGIDLDVMKQKAMEWGISTQFSAVQVSGAMAEAARNNMTQIEILKAMPGNLALAAAGQMDLVSAMKLSTDVVNQFGKAYSNLEIADFLASASKSPSTVAQIGAALQNTGTAAHQAGLSVKATTKWLMAMGEVGLRGEAGGTMLKNMIKQMKMMSPKLKKGFGEFLQGTGLQLSDIINLETKQFVDPDRFTKLLMNASKKQMGALTTAMEMRGGTALSAISSLSSKQFDKYADIMDNVDGAALKLQKTIMEGLPGGLKLFNSAIETTKLVMIDSFIGPLSVVLRQLAKFLVYLSKNHSWILNVTFVVIGLTTALGLLGIAAWVVGGAFVNLKIATLFLGHAFAWTTIKAFIFKTLIIAVSAVARVAAFGVKLWTAAQWLLNAAMSANPISLVIIGVAALAALFVYAWHKTGSWTNALKFMGGMMIKSVLTPMNLIIGGVRLLLKTMSLIPGATGEAFKTAHKHVADFQDKWNTKLTGNKSLTVLGMGYDLSQKGDKASAWSTEAKKQEKRMEYVTKNTGEMAPQAAAPTGFWGKMISGYKAPPSEMSGYIPPTQKASSPSLALGQMAKYTDPTQKASSPALAVGQMANYMAPTQRASSSSLAVEQMTRQAVTQRKDATTKPLEIVGNIKVSAENGVKILDKKFTVNTGRNMYTLAGAF